MMPAMAPLEMPSSSLSVLVAGVVLTAGIVVGMAVDVSVVEVTEVTVSDVVVDVLAEVVLLVVVVDVAEVVEVVDVVVAYRHLYSGSKQTNAFAWLHKSALGSHSSFTSK